MALVQWNLCVNKSRALSAMGDVYGFVHNSPSRPECDLSVTVTQLPCVFSVLYQFLIMFSLPNSICSLVF